MEKTVLASILLVITLIPITLTQMARCASETSYGLALKSMDTRPGIYTVYIDIPSGTIINVTYKSPGKYYEDPQVNVTVKINETEYWSTFSLRDRRIIEGVLNQWKYYPLWIPKGLKLDSIVKVYGSDFRVIEVSDEITITNQTLTLIYDKFSGVFVRGDLIIKSTIFHVQLIKTNMKFRRKLFEEIYLDWEKLTKMLSELNATLSENKIKIYSIGKSCLGRNIWACEIPARSMERAVIVIDGGMHGSEVIGVKVAVYILSKILTEHAEIKALDYITLIVVPMLNPDGVEASKILPPQPSLTLKYARRNARGVDLNRNFAYGWNEGGSTDYECPDFKGIKPETEPEVKALLNIFKTRNVKFYINLHSGINVTIIPGYEKNPYLEMYVNEIARGIANIFNHPIARGKIYGGSANWVLFAYENKALSVIIELYGNRGQLEMDWFNLYNPTTEIEIEEICEKTYYATLYVIGKTLTWTQRIEESKVQLGKQLIIIAIIPIFIIGFYAAILKRKIRRSIKSH